MAQSMAIGALVSDRAAGSPSSQMLTARIITTDLSSLAVERAIIAPPQHPDWLEAWASSVNPDLFAACLFDQAGRVVFAIPLEVVESRGQKLARFVGGSHANGNFPIIGRDGATIPPSAVDSLIHAIRQARPDVDLLALERMAAELDGISNPLARSGMQQSPNVALAASLDGGFESVLQRASKRKAKRFRAQQKKFDELGGAFRHVAASEDDIDNVLTAYFLMKAERLKAMGVENTFAEERTQAFFRHLFKSGLQTGDFYVTSLTVAGKVRAVTGHSRCGGRVICEFAGITSDEISPLSPGDHLFYMNIETACSEGLEVFDFSTGDEPYKRSWCDTEQHQIDLFVPLTARGKLLTQWLVAKSTLKGTIKSSPLWPLLKRLRKQVRGAS